MAEAGDGLAGIDSGFSADLSALAHWQLLEQRTLGNDTLEGDAGTDDLWGDGGSDTASYVDHTVAVTVTLDGLANDGSSGENDHIEADVENAEQEGGA